MLSDNASRTAVVAYVASPHAGYLKLFRKYAGAALFILGEDFIAENVELTRHLPGNSPQDAQVMIRALGVFSDVRILEKNTLGEVRSYGRIIMPDEVISHHIATDYFGDTGVQFDGAWRLRWDWRSSRKEQSIEGAVVVSVADADRALMARAYIVAERSPDWWRQVGALLAQQGCPKLVAFNRHTPTEQAAYLECDPRSSFAPGECIEISLAVHAELGLIAEAARLGLSLNGCDLYVTTFPCPVCAGVLARTGIKKIYYAEGYSLIKGADALRAGGVQLIRVAMTNPSPSLG